MLLASCEKDLYETGIQNGNRKISLTSVPVHKLMQIPKFNTAYSKAKRAKPDPKLSGVKRTALEEMYNFTLDTVVLAKVLEMSGKISYTMLIKNEVIDPLTFKNLVIQIDEANNMYAEIIKYNLSKAPVKTTQDSYLLDIVNKDINVLVDEYTVTMGLATTPCTYIVVCYQPYSDGSSGGGHTPTSACLSESNNLVIEISCGGGGGGGDSGSGGDTSTGGNNSDGNGTSTGSTGGGGSPGTPPSPNGPNIIITTPVLVTDPDLTTDPCEKIKKQLSENPQIVDELSNMANKTSENTEWGRYKITSANVIQTPASTASGQVSFPFPSVGVKYTMMAHTHNSPAEQTFSVFSWTDLVQMGEMIKNNQIDSNHFVAYLATADGTYFALTIEDPYTFGQFFALSGQPNFDMNIAENRVNEANKYFGELSPNNDPIIKENNTDLYADKKAFLQFLQNNNLGVSLFESNQNFSTFTKLAYNPTTNNVDSENCQ